MLKHIFIVLLTTLLSSCSTMRFESSVVLSDNTVKSCNYESIDSARRGAIIQYLEEKGVSVKVNNNSICNNLGCMQEEEIRSYSKNNISATYLKYNSENNCHYFNIKKLNNEVVKNIGGNHEGRFDISSESNKSFISINVLNIKDPILAKMNNEYVTINNGIDIKIDGAKTLKFSINTMGFEKKEFIIKTSNRPEKIIKNITLVRDSRSSPEQEEIGYGFKKINGFNFCKLILTCSSTKIDTIVNDRPFDTRMIKGYTPHDSLEERAEYFLFHDVNLHKAMKYKFMSYKSNNDNLIIRLVAQGRRGSEFVKVAREIIGENSYISFYHKNYSIPHVNVGSAPFLRLYFEVSVYDKFGNHITTRDMYVHLITDDGYPSFDNSKVLETTISIPQYYQDTWTIRYKAKFKISKFEPTGYNYTDRTHSYHRDYEYFKNNSNLTYNVKSLKKYFPKK